MTVLLLASSEDAKNNNQMSWTLWGVLHELTNFEGLPIAEWLVDLESRFADDQPLQRAITQFRSVGWPVMQRADPTTEP